METIGCPSASNRFASLQTEKDIHEVDELGEELLQGAEGTQPMNRIGKETPCGSLTKASPRVVDAEENLHEKSRDILERVHLISVRRAVLVKENEEWKEKMGSIHESRGRTEGQRKRQIKSKPAEGGPAKATRGNAQRASKDSITKTVS